MPFLIIDVFSILLISIAIIVIHRLMEKCDCFRIPQVIFAVKPIGVLAAGWQNSARNLFRRTTAGYSFLNNSGKTNPSDTRSRSGKVTVYKFFA